MRIIAGEYGGRPILGPKDARTTRPITDRVKESLFDRLAAAGRLEEAVVADVFAGTGSMGLECLSRGAEHVSFVERDRDAAGRLSRNLQAIDMQDRARILRVDALGESLLRALGERQFTLIFVDPPYPMVEHPARRNRVWRQVDRLREIAADDARLVLRTPKQVALGQLDNWPDVRSHTYNMMTLHLLS